eukprot:5838018-Pyramimonas_sp.AAC.2
MSSNAGAERSGKARGLSGQSSDASSSGRPDPLGTGSRRQRSVFKHWQPGHTTDCRGARYSAHWIQPVCDCAHHHHVPSTLPIVSDYAI